MRLYLILGGLVFGYFVLIHATRSAHRLPKELAVGVCFAAAVFIPTVSRRPALHLPLIPPAILFAALCSLNCLFIYAWEHPKPTANNPPHAVTQFALRYLTQLSILNLVAGTGLALLYRHTLWPVCAAISCATVVLLILDARRRHHTSLTLRASADFALLTPLLLIPFL